MSSAYLQRLVDRVAAAPPAIVSPGGPSRSPVAEADQRLNEPGFADLFSFVGAVGDAETDVAPTRAADAAIPRRQSPAIVSVEIPRATDPLRRAFPLSEESLMSW